MSGQKKSNEKESKKMLANLVDEPINDLATAIAIANETRSSRISRVVYFSTRV